MPETRPEWVLFTLGLAVIAVLGLAVARHYTRNPPRHPGATSTRAPAPATARVTSNSPATAAATTTTTGTTTTEEAATLSLRALDDTWVSVRRGSATGTTLYEGTLAKGKSETFTGSAFWVRFGGASNVAATLDGRPLDLPGGTYSVPVTRAGLGARQG